MGDESFGLMTAWRALSRDLSEDVVHVCDICGDRRVRVLRLWLRQCGWLGVQDWAGNSIRMHAPFRIGTYDEPFCKTDTPAFFGSYHHFED